MTTTISDRNRLEPGRLEQLSTRIAFFVAGFGVSAWAPLVPFLKARTGIPNAQLSLLLLCMGTGAIIAMPLAGAVAARYGCRIPILLASGIICLVLPVLASSSFLPAVGIALCLFGVGIGTLDCTMNIQAVIVERASKRPMMSGFHGLFSVGGFTGAGCVSLLLSSGVTPLTAASIVVAVILTAMTIAARNLLPYGGHGGVAFMLPRGPFAFVGIICFMLFLVEGSMLNWSALFFADTRSVDPIHAGLAYTVFATAMTIGRLSGDFVVERIGSKRIITLGGLLAGLGLAMATVVPSWDISLFSYALVGAGCSNIVPMLFSAIGRQTVIPESVAVPTLTMIGYAGALVGPASVGLVASQTSLTTAFLLLSFLLFAVGVSGRFLRI